MNTYIDFFKALSDGTRLRIMHILLIAKKELCACEFTDILEVSTYNISKHLKILRQSNLITERKEGRWVYFGIQPTNEGFLNLLKKAILEIENPQLEIDIEELYKRLNLRVNDTCPIGVQKAHLKSKSGIKCC